MPEESLTQPLRNLAERMKDSVFPEMVTAGELMEKLIDELEINLEIENKGEKHLR